MQREDRTRKKRRRNRWGPPDLIPPTGVGALPKYIPGGLSTEQQEALAVRVRIEEITRKINFNDLDLDPLERSPSPEPIYDTQGKRLNTRDQRAKDKLALERQKMVEMAMAMSPAFKPPADYIPFSTKKTKKIFIPIQKYPEYNFIGLIIGPRGNTQKKMEKETGCKIVIRGKGSVKEGNRGRKDGKPNPGEDDELHVLITADTESQLEKAGRMITDLLVPKEEGNNEHKRMQLEELARINGTLRDKSWSVNTERSFDRKEVKCGICGEQSHPSSDCPLRGKGMGPYPGAPKLESEFDKFLSEIGEAPEGKGPADVYDDFIAAIGTGGSNSAAPPWAAQTSAPYAPTSYTPYYPPATTAALDSAPTGPPSWVAQGGYTQPWTAQAPTYPPATYPPQAYGNSSYGGAPWEQQHQ